MSAIALQTRQTQVCNKLDNSSECSFDSLLEAGVGSILSLPLQHNTDLLGALTVFSTKAAVFGADEILLMEELAGDLAFGITTLRARQDLTRTDEELRELNQQLELSLVGSVILLIYAYVASTLPVWQLLQPRDFINGYQLFIALGLLVLGVLFSHPQIAAPAFQQVVDAPPLLPLLFITVACGAISGFHSLVASGTTSKQMANENHALAIGYDSHAPLLTCVL